MLKLSSSKRKLITKARLPAMVAPIDRAQDSEQRLQAAFSYSLTKDFVALSDNDGDRPTMRHVAALEKYMSSRPEGYAVGKAPLLLGGTRGCGMSSFLANWCAGVRARVDQSTAPIAIEYYTGASRRSSQLRTFLRQMCRMIVSELSIDQKHLPNSEAGLIKSFRALLKQASERATIVLVVDGFDRLVDEKGDSASWQWIPEELPLDVDLVLSFSVSRSVLEAMHKIAPPESQLAGTQAHGPQEQEEQEKQEIAFLTSSSDNHHQRQEEQKHQRKDQESNVHSALFASLKGQLGCRVLKKAISAKHQICSLESMSSSEARTALLRYLAKKNSSESDVVSTNFDSSVDVRLVQGQVDALVAKFEAVESAGFLFDLLKAVKLAARMGFDVTALVNECTSQDVANRAELLDRILFYFARGNYPTPSGIAECWRVARDATLQPAALEELNRTSKLPSTQETARRQEIVEAIQHSQTSFASDEKAASNQDGDEDDERYDDDFDQVEPGSDTPKADNDSPLFAATSKVPVYLLGGYKVEPLGDILLKSLGFVASACRGLTLDEIDASMYHATKSHQIGQSSGSNVIDSSGSLNDEDESKANSIDSFEAWLGEDAATLSQGLAAKTETNASVLTPAQRCLLEEILPVLALKDSAGVFSLAPRSSGSPLLRRGDENMRVAILKAVVLNESHAPSNSNVIALQHELDIGAQRHHASTDVPSVLRQGSLVISKSTEPDAQDEQSEQGQEEQHQRNEKEERPDVRRSSMITLHSDDGVGAQHSGFQSHDKSPESSQESSFLHVHSDRGAHRLERSNLKARWRLVLVRTFLHAPTGQRKAEELPWLLERNARTVALRDCIIEPRLFSLMWAERGTLRADVLRVWRCLSSTCTSDVAVPRPSSPVMHANENAASMGLGGFDSIGEGDEGDSDLERDKEDVFDEDDESDCFGSHVSLSQSTAGLSTTDSSADRGMFRFDPVETYAKAMEEYQNEMDAHTGKNPVPAMSHVGEIYLQLAEFFWQLGEFEHLAPRYLHPPIPEDDVVSVKVALPHFDEARREAEDRSGFLLDLSQTGNVLKHIKEVRDAMILEQHMSQRQVAVSKIEDAKEREEKFTLMRRRSKFIGLLLNQRAEEEERDLLERAAAGKLFAGNNGGENFHSYQRWAWTMFPMMALYHATTVRILTNQERTKTLVLPAPRQKTALSGALGGNKQKPQGIAKPQFPPKLKRVGTVIQLAPSKTAMDFWNRKKQDVRKERSPMPRISSVTSLLALKNKADKARRAQEEKSMKELAIKVNVDEADRHEGDPELLRRGYGPYLHEAKRLPRNTVPFSSPSNRTLAQGTKFPTFDASNKHETVLDIFHGGNLDSATIKESFKTTVAQDTGKTSVVSFVSSNLATHLQSYIPTEHETRVAELNGMLTSMRRTLDTLRAESGSKERQLDEMMQDVHERDEADRFTEAFISRGEHIMTALRERLSVAEEEIAKAQHANRFLKRVIEVCVAHPARDEKHILHLEARLAEMRDDRLSLRKDLDEVVQFTKRAMDKQRPALLESVRTRREMHKQVLGRLERWADDTNSKWADKKNRKQGRAEIVQEIHSTPTTIGEAHRLWTKHRQMLYKSVMPDQFEGFEQELRLKNGLKRLRKAAKSADPSVIAKRYNELVPRKEQLCAQIVAAKETKEALKQKLTALQAERMQAKRAHKNRKQGSGGTDGDILAQMNRNCVRSEARLKEARADSATTNAALKRFERAFAQLHLALGQAGAPIAHVDPLRVIEPAKTSPGAKQIASKSIADATCAVEPEQVRKYVTDLMGPFCQDLEIPDVPRFNSNFRKHIPSKQELLERRKFLFGTGMRKPANAVSLPPAIFTGQKHRK